MAPELKELFKLPLVDGILIEVVKPVSPAQEAKLNGGELEVTLGGYEFLIGGDIITAIDDATISTPEEFAKALESLKVGSNVRLTLFRNGKTRQVTCTLPASGRCCQATSVQALPMRLLQQRDPIEDSLVRILIRRSRLVVQGPSQRPRL